tara:strand:+ start:2597 stop:2989 length:393 start_codon:yes stop_codon:yes gene_type:complete
MFADLIVRINQSYLEDYDLLTERKDKGSPFQIRKDVFMAAVAYGFSENKSKPVKNPHDLFRTSTFAIEDTVVLKALFLKKNKMEFGANYTDENVLNQAMEWAEAGFKYLKLDTIQEQGSNFNCLMELVIN